MDYKEKYEMALEGIQEILGSGEDSIKMSRLQLRLQGIFPELKESEDEEIRKAIHIYLDWLDGRKDYAPKGEYTIRDMIAWVVKQGKHQKFRDSIQVGDKVTRNEDGVLVNLSQLNRVAKKQGKQETLCDKCRKEQPSASCQDITELGRCALEKQGEQKPYGQREECTDCQFNYAGECKGSCTMKRGEQKPTYEEMKELLRTEYEKGRADVIAEKSWSEEDELHIRELESLVKQVWATAEHENDKDTIHKMSDLSFFLKTLKPQPKQEWSEEDETVLNNLIYALANDRIGNNRDEYVNWLKSLRPHNTWKPSEEMLEALYRAIPENVMEISEDEMLLDKLYQGLKYGRVLSNK